MIAVLSIGDCELLMLRRTEGRQSDLEAVFHTEMQRIDYNVQTPLQLARVDGRIDEDFDESIAFEVIEKGSAVHCVSAYEGDILVLGSDGVFDNLFLDEIVEVCNEILRPSKSNEFNKSNEFKPMPPSMLSQVAQRIVRESHAKSEPQYGQFIDTPIGKGGKVDDTSVVVAEIVEWTEAHREIWSQVRRNRKWKNAFSCGAPDLSCGGMQCGTTGQRNPCVSCEAEEEDLGLCKVNSRGLTSRDTDDSASGTDNSEEEEASNCTLA
jgi:serine/threonine protein phosphatase PrpC